MGAGDHILLCVDVRVQRVYRGGSPLDAQAAHFDYVFQSEFGRCRRSGLPHCRARFSISQVS